MSKIRRAARAVRPSRREAAPGFILGPHPAPPSPFGEFLDANDRRTQSKAEHRALVEKDGVRTAAVHSLQEMLLRHHASREALKRTRKHREAIKQLGLEAQQARLRRFPTNVSTQKGNLAEIVLAEYVVAAAGVLLPVYRLRYNPNVDQSMKGDDVLAFDLDAKPTRILVGEAKFRGTSSAAAVKEIVAALVRSFKGGVPASLQFVADRLFEEGHAELADRVVDCWRQFALGALRIDYVGMLLSDTDAAERVDSATPGPLRRLAMISFGVDDPTVLVEACYRGLE